MKDINKNIAMNIQNYLNLLNITQKDLSKKLGCSNTTISMWIKGNSTPRIDKIDKMCEIFGCERKDIISDTPKTLEEVKKDQIMKTFELKFRKMKLEDQLYILSLMEKYEEGE
jgi:repressor LexA